MSENTITTALRTIVLNVEPQLAQLPGALTHPRPAPDKWSKKELLGHLLDSALNNSRRFILAQRQEELVLEGYEQDFWVQAQHYAEVEWKELLILWKATNLQLARIIDAIPDEIRYKKQVTHNFHEIAFRLLAPGEETSLDYLILDYVGHLEYHLAQLIDGYTPIGGKYSDSQNLRTR